MHGRLSKRSDPFNFYSTFSEQKPSGGGDSRTNGQAISRQVHRQISGQADKQEGGQTKRRKGFSLLLVLGR